MSMSITFEDHTGQDWHVHFDGDVAGKVTLTSHSACMELPFSVVRRLTAEVVRFHRMTAIEQASPEDMLS